MSNATLATSPVDVEAAFRRPVTVVTSRVFVPSWPIVFVVSVAALAPLPAWAQTGPQARAAQVQRVGGTVEARRGAAGPWTRLRPGGELLRGDSVRTYPASFAQLNFDVGGQWQLPAESELDLTPAVTDGPGRITVRLQSGRVVARWRPDQQVGQTARVTVVTPSGQASIVGTEWSLRVEPDGKSTLLVLDGRVEFWNEVGSVSVAANEAAEMAVGRAPAKLLLLSPEDRVQWVAAYQPDPARYSVGGDTLANTELIQADALIGGGDLAAARARVEAGQKRFPADARFDALLSRLTLFEGQSAASRSAADAAVAKDATAVDGWLALGEWGIREGDLTVAQRGFAGAGFVAPQDGRAWFGLGSIASDREEFPSAKRFLGTALRLDPDGPGYRGQLGLTYTLANQLGRAAKEYAAALEQQPDDYVSLTGRALLALKQGRENEAIELLQRVTLFEPRYARAHMYLGVAYYRKRRVDDAVRELERASREDPRDPLPYMMLTQVHTDLYEPWKAVEAARAAQERMPYLKSFNQLSNTVKGGANLGNAMAFFGLEEWAMSLAQSSYDPFWAGSHLFLGDRYRSEYARFSEYFQGLLTDPTAFGGSPRFQTLLSRPATYVTAGITRSGDQVGAQRAWNSSLAVNGLSTHGRPMSYFLGPSLFSGRAAENDRVEDRSWAGAVGLAASPNIRLLAVGSHGTQAQTGQIWTGYRLASDVNRFDVGGSVHVSPSRMWWFKADTDDTMTDFAYSGIEQAFRTRTRGAQVRHTWVAATGLEVSAGSEVSWSTVRLQWSTDKGLDGDEVVDNRAQLAYGSTRMRVGSMGHLQADLFVTHERTSSRAAGQVSASTSVLPRLGAAVSLGGGRLLRVAFQQWRPQTSASTLAPVATAGLPLDSIFIGLGGALRSYRAQLEWPLAPRTLVSAFIARNEKRPHDEIGLVAPPTLNLDAVRNITRDASRLSGAGDSGLPGKGIYVLPYDTARATTGGLAINQIVSRAVSVYARYQARESYAFDSRTICGTFEPGVEGSAKTMPCQSGTIPFYPTHAVAVGGTLIHPRRIYADAQLVFRGRYTSQWPPPCPRGSQTSCYYSDSGFRVSGSWETPAKSWSIETTASNVFEDIDPAFRFVLANERLKFTLGARYRW